MLISKFILTLSPIDKLYLPNYAGSTLRGGFGHAFKKVVCTLKKQTCKDCILKSKCIYSYIFETPLPNTKSEISTSSILKSFPSTAPHPFIIEPPDNSKNIYTQDDKLKFSLILIGRAIEYLPYFIYAFEELGKIGIGKGKGKFNLLSVSNIKSNNFEKIIYNGQTKILIDDYETIKFTLSAIASDSEAAPTSWTLRFLTPTRLKFEGHLTSNIEFHTIIRSLLRRISLLSSLHCGENLNIDFKKLIKFAQKVKLIKSNIQWHDWERYSARQDTKMKLGGFIGSLTFEGDISPFLPFLKLGELIHLGKGTTFGLGKYSILL